MEWDEYISHLLSDKDVMKNLTISLDGGQTVTNVPPLIRASISMLDKIIEHQGKLNIIVFPERVQSIFIFTLMKLYHNISIGKIQSNYDPTGFIPGEKLKVGNAVVEYLGYEKKGAKTYLKIKLADVDLASTPIKDLPVFQRASTSRRLSKWAKFSAEKKAAMSSFSRNSKGIQALTYVKDMKTHMASSIYTMTSVASAKEQLSRCTINGKKVTSIFYIAQTDYEGKTKNISPGQMAGIPAIVFASDLYAISNAADNKNPIQSIIIDASNTNVLMGQLDALDTLLGLRVPVVCITDIANSFELDAFVSRGFNLWRWDNDSLTDQLYNAVALSSDKKTRNCAHQSIKYLTCEDTYICNAIRKLSLHRKDTEEQSPQMMKLFERLNNLVFSALRSTTPFEKSDLVSAEHLLSECKESLSLESSYLDNGSIEDYKTVISSLEPVYTDGYSIKKNEMLKNYFREHPLGTILLVIPENTPKNKIQSYWNSWRLKQNIKNKITVLHPSEYYNMPAGSAETTVICGWLKRAIMRKIIFSYNTNNYVVLLYNYENRWKNHDSHRWAKALSNKGNKAIIEKSFSSDLIPISTVRYEKPLLPETTEVPDELGEIELILQNNKYRQYVNGDGHYSSESVCAIPVNFVGGFLAFYRTSHKVVSATKIIMSDGDKIETKLPTELRVGDFIVVRETDKDLVREIADIILLNSGKSTLRDFASKWREALKIELLFCTEEDFCEKVKAAGCSKSISTIKRWIDDEDIIAPKSKDDLKILASVTENEMLIEMLDAIFEAAQQVRNAHILAGRKLSEQLKRTLAEEIKKFENIDPFNFWEPINMEIDGIGNVKVLKITDVGSEIQIDIADTNRLIEG